MFNDNYNAWILFLNFSTYNLNLSAYALSRFIKIARIILYQLVCIQIVGTYFIKSFISDRASFSMKITAN